MSYARGRWERIRRQAENRPWLRYVATLDDRVRPDHRRWHGVLLRVGDPWRRTHFPPNGWGCRCIVEQLSDDDLERRGYAPLPDNVRPADEGMTRPWHNDRTGETVQVPVGIDPGWAHNAGLVDPVAGARAVLRGKLAAAPPAQRAALLDTWEDYVAEGRAARDEIERGISETPGTVEHANAFRAGLRAMLRDRRAAGELDAERFGPFRPALKRRREKAGPGAPIGHRDDERLVKAVRDAARWFPRSWIEAANKVPALFAVHTAGRGFYADPLRNYRHRGRLKQRGAGLIAADASSQPTVLHEFVHHLQYAVLGLDARFQALHRARTAGDKVEPIYLRRPKERGRPDDYVERYAGREYSDLPPEESALEVMTVTFEQLLADPAEVRDSPYRLLLRDDPELAALAIGLLMRYDPDP